MSKARISELMVAKNDVEALRKNSEKLSARAWYWLGKIHRYLTKEFEDFQEAQNNLVKKFGEPVMVEEKDETGVVILNEDGNPKMIDSGNVQVRKDKLAEFQRELQALVRDEVELAIHDLDLDILEGVELLSDTLAVSIFFAEPKRKED